MARPEQWLQSAADPRDGDPGRLAVFFPRLDWDLLLLLAPLFQGQETVGQHHQAGAVVYLYARTSQDKHITAPVNGHTRT
jgi:hypothetical protein